MFINLIDTEDKFRSLMILFYTYAWNQPQTIFLLIENYLSSKNIAFGMIQI